jgi:hypothetical protein
MTFGSLYAAWLTLIHSEVPRATSPLSALSVAASVEQPRTLALSEPCCCLLEIVALRSWLNGGRLGAGRTPLGPSVPLPRIRNASRPPRPPQAFRGKLWPPVYLLVRLVTIVPPCGVVIKGAWVLGWRQGPCIRELYRSRDTPCLHDLPRSRQGLIGCA